MSGAQFKPELAYWKKRLKEDSAQIRLVQVPAKALTKGSAALRLVVDDRFAIEVPDGFTASTLARIVEVVRGL